jgi:hypothetical protein
LITWSEIIAECGNYRSGFVAVFRRYEGQPTDALTEQGHVVKVTVQSFARHVGVEATTFRDWIKRAEVTDFVTSKAKEARTATSHANVVKNLTRKDPAALVDAIEQAGPAAADQALQELKLRRAGVDTSRAARKAADAAAHRQVEPILEALAMTDIELCIAALKNATEHLQSAISAGVLTNETVTQIGVAFEAFQFTLTEARFGVS